MNPSLPPHQQEQLHEEGEVPTPLARRFGHFSEGLPPQLAFPGDGEVLEEGETTTILHVMLSQGKPPGLGAGTWAC